MPDAPARSFPAVIEDGTVRVPPGLPFRDGDEVQILIRPAPGPSRGTGTAPTPADARPPVNESDPLVRLSKLVGDGPPDGSTHVDEYKLGLKTWPH